MKKHLSIMLLSSATLLISACSSHDRLGSETSHDHRRIVKGDNEKDTITLVVNVADRSTPCKFNNKRQCLVIKTGTHRDWHEFTDAIEGFTYQSGYKYLLEIRKYPANPEDKNSKNRYRLINQIKKEKVM